VTSRFLRGAPRDNEAWQAVDDAQAFYKQVGLALQQRIEQSSTSAQFVDVIFSQTESKAWQADPASARQPLCQLTDPTSDSIKHLTKWGLVSVPFQTFMRTCLDNAKVRTAQARGLPWSNP
jgi:hypothetical protein